MRNTTFLGARTLFLRLLLVEALVLAIDSVGSSAAQRETALAQSCAAPADAEERAGCAALEEQILDVTVFLRFTMLCGPDGDRSGRALVASHATVVDSRALLTHDHFARLSDPDCDPGSLEVFAARGALLAEIEDPTPLGDLIRQLRPDQGSSGVQARTLVFQMPLFTPLPGLVFERFSTPPGEEVLEGWGELAQVNWHSYPRRTYVQWVKPVSAEMHEGAYGLVVGKQVEIGASGGGVFRIVAGQPVQVGNVWATWQDDEASLIALNQAEVLR